MRAHTTFNMQVVFVGILAIMGCNALLQAQRDAYVHLPAEFRSRNMLWLLVVATYGPVNCNCKWQKQSDDAFLNLGLQQIPNIPQLFATDDSLSKSTFLFNKQSKLGEPVHGPGPLHFFVMNIIQNKDYSIFVHDNEKRNQLDPYPILRAKHH